MDLSHIWWCLKPWLTSLCKEEVGQDKADSWSLPGMHLDGPMIPSSLITSQWYWKAVDTCLNCVNQKRQCAEFVNANLNNFSVALSALSVPWALLCSRKKKKKMLKHVSPTLSLKVLQGCGAEVLSVLAVSGSQLCCSHLSWAPLHSQQLSLSPISHSFGNCSFSSKIKPWAFASQHFILIVSKGH